jgi:hypothetical protein
LLAAPVRQQGEEACATKAVPPCNTFALLQVISPCSVRGLDFEKNCHKFVLVERAIWGWFREMLPAYKICIISVKIRTFLKIL